MASESLRPAGVSVTRSLAPIRRHLLHRFPVGEYSKTGTRMHLKTPLGSQKMQEESQLIKAAHAYIMAGMAKLQNERPEIYSKATDKLDVGQGRLTLVITRDQSNWRCHCLISDPPDPALHLFRFEQGTEVRH
jgi:hypothetical protein